MDHVETLSPILPPSLERRVEALLRGVCARDWTIATAESCTGGLLASLLTDVDGCGRAFDRAFVVYSAAAKCELLDIANAELDRCGAVSRPVALAMARGRAGRLDRDTGAGDHRLRRSVRAGRR